VLKKFDLFEADGFFADFADLILESFRFALGLFVLVGLSPDLDVDQGQNDVFSRLCYSDFHHPEIFWAVFCVHFAVLGTADRTATFHPIIIGSQYFDLSPIQSFATAIDPSSHRDVLDLFGRIKLEFPPRIDVMLLVLRMSH